MNLNQFYHYYKSKSGGLSNLLLGSEELDQSDQGEWVRYNMNAVNADQVNNPAGTEQTAEQLDFEASRTARIAQTVTLTAGTEYTFSVWARAASGTEPFRLRYWDNVGGSGGGSAFTASATWDESTGRYEMTFTAQNSGQFQMFIQNAADGATRRIYFWGAMLNVGGAALDYVKTEFPAGPSNPPTAPMEFGDNFAGVTAYYSLRRFTKGEDNNAIRVRRSSDDTEQDIGFDANGDLDTTALLAFVGSQNLADWSENFGNFSLPSNVTLTSGVTDPFGGTDATELISSTDGWLLRDGLGHIQSGTQYTVSIYARAKTAGVKNGFRFILGSAASSNIETTTTWTRYTATITANGTACGIYRTSPNSFAEIEIYGFQINEGTSAQSYATTSGTYLEGNGAVTTFYDQSGNGNNATNATASEQPLVVSGGSVLVDGNGKAKIQATVSTQYLTATRINPNPLYAFYALEKGTSTGAFSGFTGQWANSYAIFFGSTRASVFDTSGTRHNVARGTTMTSGNRYLISAVFDNDIEIYQDGTLEGNVSAVGDLRFSDASQKLFFFGYSGGNADPDSCLQEVIFFNSDQSSNRTGIETNINDHFDIYT